MDHAHATPSPFRTEKPVIDIKQGTSIRVETEEVFTSLPSTPTLADRPMEYDRVAIAGLPKQTVVGFNLSTHPGFNSCRQDVTENQSNFLPASRVDILTVSGPETFHDDQNDAQVEAIMNSSTGNPAMMAICIKLEANPDATFEQTSWISKSLVERLFKSYDIHSGFLLDLIGRPNYWSAVSQVKSDVKYKKDVFEFFCQHPRWHPKSRYDKQKNAMQGNRAPCSLYMTYCTATDTTIYLIVAPDDGIWFAFLDTIRLAVREGSDSLISGRELASSPFFIHSMISNIAFEQAAVYTADARVKLMIQLHKVNNYSDSLDSAGMGNRDPRDSETRQTLSSITRQLHDVSQMIDTALGSSSAAVKLSTKLLQAHEEFCRRTGRGATGTAVSRTQTAIQYVHDAYLCQQSWLEQYKARKETAMNLVFNMVTQDDSFITLNTSYQMSQDSASIHALTVLAMIFLPGTFTAVWFTTGYDLGCYRADNMVCP
ncbi:uncharacterized protein FIESC28_11308 [Fusarium coffeatum]|uniref:Uncharacterized protein n=1 Tax=Fusarium coffeatum TaxID=231269 RepID=A0A366QLB3_9HYPO|nr:uncharacterized protein FIESC28_11308 [Fusarium coffeatum]RBR05719.1 hypothetical protein FIESC28_11308 [Fusarium coffeatum]